MAHSLGDPVETRLEWAVRIAREAGDLTLGYFRRPNLAVEFKADASPVTAADRAAEQLLRKRIAERFPNDSILGEEFGAAVGSSGHQRGPDPVQAPEPVVH